MTESKAPAGSEKSLLLDKLDGTLAAFQALRKSDAAATDEILSSLGAQDDVDRDIVLELSSPRPLGHPERFEQAHRLTVRALEVLDRNGSLRVKVHGLGPLDFVAAFLAQQVAQFIVRSHQASVTDKMLRLYARREANSRRDDPARRMLMLARVEMQRLSPGFKRNALGAATFLVGGAALSGLLRLLQNAAAAFSSLGGKIIATVTVRLVVAAIAWVVLRGAAVARRRIHLTLDQPLAVLPWVLTPAGVAVSWLTG